jgi:hypothetical protein
MGAQKCCEAFLVGGVQNVQTRSTTSERRKWNVVTLFWNRLYYSDCYRNRVWCGLDCTGLGKSTLTDFWEHGNFLHRLFWRRIQYWDVASDDRCPMNWKGFGRRRLWLSRDTILTVSSVDWRTLRKPSVRIADVQTSVRTEHLPNASVVLILDQPKFF